MSQTSSTAVLIENPSAEQLSEASRHLTDTRDALVESVAGLSPEQWNHKPASDRWSIAEIVEHIVIVERRVQANVDKISEAPPPPEGWNANETDAIILAKVPDRSWRLSAPPLLWPTEKWSRTVAMEHFLKTREDSLRRLANSCLRGHVISHPVLGPWDGYQWLLAVGAHGARHTEQIREVKCCSDFPASTEAAVAAEPV